MKLVKQVAFVALVAGAVGLSALVALHARPVGPVDVDAMALARASAESCAAPIVVPLERVAPPPECVLRLINEVDGRAMPDQVVVLTKVDAPDTTLQARLVDGLARVVAPPGSYLLESAADPAAFAACEVSLTAPAQQVRVVPLLRLSLRVENMAGVRLAPAVTGFEYGLLAAERVAAVVATAPPLEVADRIEQMECEPVRDGQLVVASPPMCVVVRSRGVANVRPANVAWFGEKSGARNYVPRVGGASCPVSATIAGAPGSDFEVVVVTGSVGAIELDVSALPPGSARFVLRRAGFAGVDSIGHSWKIARRELVALTPSAVREPVRFAGLLPGAYKLDLVVQGRGEVTCGVLAATVGEAQTVCLAAERGIGTRRLVLEGLAPGATVQAFFQTGPLLDWPEGGPMWSQAPRFGGEGFEPSPLGSMVVQGLCSAVGTLTVARGGRTATVSVDLERDIVYRLPPP